MVICKISSHISRLQLLGTNGALIIFPALRYVPGDPFKFKTLRYNVDQIQGNIRKHIDLHKAKRKESEIVEDFIDAYLEHMEKEKDNENTSFHGRDSSTIYLYHMN